jgi:hypothetical protein
MGWTMLDGKLFDCKPLDVKIFDCKLEGCSLLFPELMKDDRNE